MVVKKIQAEARPVIEASQVGVPKKESPKVPTDELKKPVKEEVKEEVKPESSQAKPIEKAKKADEDEDWVLSEAPAKPVPPEVAKKE